MTTKYSTKKALISSIVVLALCFSMLIGTTFAWFTDSASSNGNIIKTGKLDVEMYWADGKEDPANTNAWNDASKGAIFNYDNWEPGYVDVRHVRISNLGTLALKYKVLIVADGEVSDLADVIDVYYADPAVQITNRAALDPAKKLGTLTDVLANIGATGNGTLEAGKEDTITLALAMQESAGNEYMNKSIGTSFTIQVLATQLEYESDSFGNDYDAGAALPVGSAAELQMAIDDGVQSVTLVKDVTVNEPIVIPAAAATYSMRSTPAVVIDLNGKTLNTDYVEGSTTNHAYAITNNGNLILKNGTVNARGIFNYGNMVVEGVTINAIDGNGGYGVRNYAGATFTMNSGKIATTLEDDHLVNNGGYDATTLRVDEGATAVINGGVIENICDYTFAIENRGDVTVNGGTIKSVHSTVSNYGTATINGGSFTCDGLEGVTAHAVVAWDNSTTVINDGTFDGKDNYNGFNVDAVAGANVVINGGNFMPVHSGSLYGDGTIVVKGGVFFDDVSVRVADGYECTQNTDGAWVVETEKAATVAGIRYATFEEAVAAAQAGDTIKLLMDVTLAEETAIPAGVTLNGNGKQINGSIYATGDLTFEGHVKVTSFSASYYNRVITIGPGACLEVTGTGRVSLAYGNTFNITGSIENAKTADKATVQPSLIIPGGISITGGNDATMNVTNAYIVVGDTSSKNNSANGTFELNFTNSIAEFTKQFALAEPTSGKNPTFDINLKDSVMTTGTKFVVAAPNSSVTLDNSTLVAATYFRNSGEVTLENGSELTASTIQFGENGGNNGTIVVDNSTLAITASSTGHALDGKDTGKIVAKNGATVSVTYYKDMVIECDATSTFTGTEVN